MGRLSMKKILIISMTRMGDLLQTTPVMAGLKRKYPGCELSLLVNKGFVEICHLIPFIDRLYTFDLDEFIPRLVRPEFSLVDNYYYLRRLVEQLKEQSFDMVLNLTHSRASAVIAHFLDAPDTRGLTLDREGYQIIKHPWMNYFFTAVRNREFNQYNLVDIHCRCGDVNSNGMRLYLEIPPEAERYSQEFLAQRGISDQDLVIGFQPGASQEDKRWPSASFARLADLVVSAPLPPGKRQVKVILFGAPHERDIGEQIESSAKTNVINAIGKTDLAQLSALLKRCDLLVTNDTGTMHIACAVGTKVVALFMGSVLSFETGPYGEGNLVLEANIPCSPCNHHLECKNPVCKQYIRPEDVLQAISLMLTFKQQARNQNEEMRDPACFVSPLSSLLSTGAKYTGNIARHQRLRLFYTTFDQNGMLDFIPLTKCSLTKADLFNLAYRQMWPLVLDSPCEMEKLVSLDEAGIPSEQRCDELIEARAERLAQRCQLFYNVKGNGRVMLSVQDDLKALEKLARFSSRGLSGCEELIRLSQGDLKPEDIEHAKKIGKRLLKLDEQIRLLGLVHQALRPITLMFTFGKANLEDAELFPLAVRSSRLYRLLRYESILLHRLIKGCLERLT